MTTFDEPLEITHGQLLVGPQNRHIERARVGLSWTTPYTERQAHQHVNQEDGLTVDFDIHALGLDATGNIRGADSAKNPKGEVMLKVGSKAPGTAGKGVWHTGDDLIGHTSGRSLLSRHRTAAEDEDNESLVLEQDIPGWVHGLAVVITSPNNFALNDKPFETRCCLYTTSAGGENLIGVLDLSDPQPYTSIIAGLFVRVRETQGFWYFQPLHLPANGREEKTGATRVLEQYTTEALNDLRHGRRPRALPPAPPVPPPVPPRQPQTIWSTPQPTQSLWPTPPQEDNDMWRVD